MTLLKELFRMRALIAINSQEKCHQGDVVGSFEQ